MRALARLAIAVSLTLPLATTGCGTFLDSKLFGETGPREQIRIEVTNFNFNDATLHALHGGDRHRLGTAPGKGFMVFTMEWRRSEPLQIEIDILAGDRCLTRALTVDPGDEISLQIQEDPRRTGQCV